MSEEPSITPESSAQPGCELRNPQAAFMLAMKKLQAAGKSASVISGIKSLLKQAGFSQNGRNRIIHLAGDEIDAICKNIPKDDKQWHCYVSEIQRLLSKMDSARKADSYSGRPYVTTQLASAARKLASLRHQLEKGISALQAAKLRNLLMDHEWQLAPESICESIVILSAIQFLELYRNELVKPPHLKSKQTFDDYTLDEIATGDFHWMDDGGKSVWEDIRDVPLTTLYDAMPDFSSVADWFIATKPALDNIQIKRGWNYLEESSKKWHQDFESYGFPEELLSEYPSWSCVVADHMEAWLVALPPDNPYKLVPLTTPQQLLDESQKMHHCAVTYIDDCISGEVRIFSVRNVGSNQRIATAALAIHSGKWELVQLKGKHNHELIHRASVSDDPLAILLDVLVKWYNECDIK